MTWEQLIEVAEERLRWHLACRHLDPWESGELRRQHYRAARKTIADIRDYRRRAAAEADQATQQMSFETLDSSGKTRRGSPSGGAHGPGHEAAPGSRFPGAASTP